MSTQRTYRLRSKVLLAVIASLLALVVGVVVVESVFDPLESRDFPFHNQLHPYVEFRAPPNYAWQGNESPSSRTHERAIAYTNEVGFRVADPTAMPARIKPPDRIRIAILGGSTVYSGTTDAVALPGALERELRRRFPDADIEVLNAGIISAIARQQLMHLIDTVVDFNVDIVVNYDGINDSGQMIRYEHRPNFPYNFGVMERAWDDYVLKYREPLWTLVLRRSVLATALFPERFGHAYHANNIPASKLIEDESLRATYAAAYIDTWDKIRRVCAAYAIRPFFVLQPTSLYSVNERGKPNGILHDVHQANYLVYEAFRTEVGGFAAAHPELGVADLSDFLPDVGYFHDGAHVYDEVNDRIAARLAALLEPTISAMLGR